MARVYKFTRDLPALEGWLTLVQVAELLVLSKEAIRLMVLDGKFPGAKQIGGTVIVPEEEVEMMRVSRP